MKRDISNCIYSFVCMTIFFYLVLFILWAVLASFGGVIIERAREKWSTLRSIFGGRSFCPGCKTTLRRWQLIPIAGWLFQKGKCMTCNQRISRRYILSEILMWGVFVFTGWRVTQGEVAALVDSSVVWQLIFRLLLNRWLVLLIIADLFRYELNLPIRYMLLALSLVYQLFLWTDTLLYALLWGVVLATVFVVIYGAAARRQTKKHKGVFTEWFGLGDVFLAGLIWTFSGFVLTGSLEVFFLIQTVLLYLVVSSGLGIIFRLLRKLFTWDSDEHLPFIPAMIVAFWLFIFLGGVLFTLLSPK